MKLKKLIGNFIDKLPRQVSSDRSWLQSGEQRAGVGSGERRAGVGSGVRAAVVGLVVLGVSGIASGKTRITFFPYEDGRDVTREIQGKIDSLAAVGASDVELEFLPGVYNISRKFSTPKLQHISNTTSSRENADPTKHYGIYLHDLKGVKITGAFAVFVTRGEMTPLAIDNCEKVVVSGISIDAADPTVAEMMVVERTDSTLVGRVSPKTQYRLTPEGRLYWTGDGWEFTGGIAQIYNGETTLRTASPMDRVQRVVETDDGGLIFQYKPGGAPRCNAGEVYQMRHSFRYEVATFINRSKDVRFENIHYYFLGNFGVVGQYSKNLQFTNVICKPQPNSGQTCAGFADFMQMSGCSGFVKFRDCDFAGAHDDPINVHGTHLKVVDKSSGKLTVRFMHPQTYGFAAFEPGDSIALVNPHTLLLGDRACVRGIERINDYDWQLTLDRDLTGQVSEMGDVVVENLTANPDVEIVRCKFTLTPTRGILLTSRGKVVIKDNYFYKIPMSAILIANDGRSWYESGPVENVTISGNVFDQCVSPVISINPENDTHAGAVHKNIRIVNNKFISPDPNRPLIWAKSTDGLLIKKVKVEKGEEPKEIVSSQNCNFVK